MKATEELVEKGIHAVLDLGNGVGRVLGGGGIFEYIVRSDTGDSQNKGSGRKGAEAAYLMRIMSGRNVKFLGMCADMS